MTTTVPVYITLDSSRIMNFLLERKKIQLPSVFVVSYPGLNTGEALGTRIITTCPLHLNDSSENLWP